VCICIWVPLRPMPGHKLWARTRRSRDAGDYKRSSHRQTKSRRRRSRLRLRRRTKDACPLPYSFRRWCKMSSEFPCHCLRQLPFWLSHSTEESERLPLLATFAIVSIAEVLHSHFLCPGWCSCISRIAPCPITDTNLNR